jgi:carbamoyl-phosphate synthase small subunit
MRGPRARGSSGTATRARTTSRRERGKRPLDVVAYDYGIKRNILRNLVGVGCRVRVVPAYTPAAEVLAAKPDGVFLSNGPGDPDAVAGAPENVAALLGKVPVFGICLGHQILGSRSAGALQAQVRPPRRQPPREGPDDGKVEITAQNHGFAVDVESLAGKGELTHLNLNDRTVEGLA